jgi:cytosine/adenosine deaminase-related metal-dependent hydrolase
MSSRTSGALAVSALNMPEMASAYRSQTYQVRQAANYENMRLLRLAGGIDAGLPCDFILVELNCSAVGKYGQTAAAVMQKFRQNGQ